MSRRRHSARRHDRIPLDPDARGDLDAGEMVTPTGAAIATMIKSKDLGPDAGAQRVALGFDIFTPENI